MKNEREGEECPCGETREHATPSGWACIACGTFSTAAVPIACPWVIDRDPAAFVVVLDVDCAADAIGVGLLHPDAEGFLREWFARTNGRSVKFVHGPRDAFGGGVALPDIEAMLRLHGYAHAVQAPARPAPSGAREIAIGLAVEQDGDGDVIHFIARASAPGIDLEVYAESPGLALQALGADLDRALASLAYVQLIPEVLR